MLLYSLCIILVAGAAPAGPVVLENQHLRVEIEPRTHSLRFFGRPGGWNFLEPVHLTTTDLNANGWIEPGGLFTDILPLERANADLRRGPAEVVEHRPDFLLLLGPEQAATGWRFKKEFLLTRDKAELVFKLTVMSNRKEEREVRVRTTAQLGWAGTVYLPREAGRLALLRGTWPGVEDLLTSEDSYYVLPLTTSVARRRAVLSSPAATQIVQSPAGVWTRRIEVRSAVAGEESALHTRSLALLDDPSHTYQVALEAGQRGVNVGAPMIVQEFWTLEEPAPVTMPEEPEIDVIDITEIPEDETTDEPLPE